MSIPNILHQEVPNGADESGNTLHSVYGEKPVFEFEPRTHNELIELNKWVDLKRAAKIAGSRFFFLKGDLARLEMALQNYTVDFLRQRGFTFVHIFNTEYEAYKDERKRLKSGGQFICSVKLDMDKKVSPAPIVSLFSNANEGA